MQDLNPLGAEVRATAAVVRDAGLKDSAAQDAMKAAADAATVAQQAAAEVRSVFVKANADHEAAKARLIDAALATE